jgi:hypothetical protein
MAIYDGTNAPTIKVYVDSGNLSAAYFVLGVSKLASATATVSVTSASGNGTTVTYNTGTNTFAVGDTVTITGLGISSGSSLNLSAVIIATRTSTKFTVTNSTVGVSSGTGSAKVGDVLHTYVPLVTLTQIPATDVRDIAIRRGRTREDQTFQPGTMTLILDNRSGSYDPEALNATFSNGVYSMLSAGTNMKVTATWSSVEYSLFTGYIELVEIVQGLDSVVTITCVDFFKRLGNTKINLAIVGSTIASSTAASTFLTRASWAYGSSISGARVITIAGSPIDSALNGLETLASGQGGRFFCSRTGTAVFSGYDYIVPSGAAALTFSDQRSSGTIEYDNITISPGSKYLRNQITASNPYGLATSDGVTLSYTATENSYVNAGSANRYKSAGVSIPSFLTQTELDTDVGQYLADKFADPEYRVEQLDFEVTKLDALGGTIWPSFLGSDIGTKVSVARTPVYTTARTYTCLIQGFNHDIKPDSWRCSLMLSPAS